MNLTWKNYINKGLGINLNENETIDLLLKMGLDTNIEDNNNDIITVLPVIYHQ